MQFLPGAPLKPPTRKHRLKPNPKTEQERKLRAAAQELKLLYGTVSNPPSVRLEEPIQRGWVRRYVLSQEAQSRPDREMLADILLDIGPERHSRRPDFLKKKRRGSRKLVEMDQPLERILIDRWSTKRHPRRDEWKRYFHFEYQPYMGGLQWFYIFTDTHLFELKVEPYWLTHVKIIDPVALSRCAELEAWMEHHVRWKKYNRLKGIRHCSQNDDLQRKLKRKSERDLYRIRLNPEEAETNPSIQWFRFSLFVIPPRSPTEGGAPLRTETVRVQILPWGPLYRSPSLAQPAEAADLRSAQCRCKSGGKDLRTGFFLREHEPDKRAGITAVRSTRAKEIGPSRAGVQVLRVSPIYCCLQDLLCTGLLPSAGPARSLKVKPPAYTRLALDKCAMQVQVPPGGRFLLRQVLAANAKQIERPVFQAGPNGCESRRGYQFSARVAQLAEAPGREPGGWECKSPREHHFGAGV